MHETKLKAMTIKNVRGFQALGFLYENEFNSNINIRVMKKNIGIKNC
jgi:hypothetical protein